MRLTALIMMLAIVAATAMAQPHDHALSSSAGDEPSCAVCQFSHTPAEEFDRVSWFQPLAWVELRPCTESPRVLSKDTLWLLAPKHGPPHA